MTRKHIITLLLLLLCMPAMAQKKEFVHLTADELEIDSVLPHFTWSMALPANYADSVYTSEILYPEFIDMTNAEAERYVQIGGDEPGALPEVESFVSVDRKQGVFVTTFVPIVRRDGKWQKLVSFMISVKSAPVSASMRRANATLRAGQASRYASHSVLAKGDWAKIRVAESGIYQITDALIKQAGFSDPSKVKVYGYGGALQNEVLVAEELIATDDLKEVAQCVVDGKRLFHAVGPVTWNGAKERKRNSYSSYGYYFLTTDGTEPLTVDSATFMKQCYPLDEHYHVLHEKEEYSWYHGGRRLYEDTPVEEGKSKTFTLKTPGHTENGYLTVALSAEGIVNRQCTTVVNVEMNGTSLGTVTLTANDKTKNYGGHTVDEACDATKVFSVSNIAAENTIKLTVQADGYTMRPDYLALTFDTPSARPNLKTASFASPEFVHRITNQDLHADSAYQMVIIIPTSQKLRAQAERLKAFHEEHDSLRVRLVPADELFNEFSSGTPDANAYRRYMKMLYDRAQNEDEMPRYLLLFGDCAWDNRMVSKQWKAYNPDDFLLCMESENSYSEADCYVDDNFFCYLDDGEGGNPASRDMPDVAVGRFPVRTAEQAKVMVDKTINYVKNENAGSWQNTVVFMGDDGNGNVHMNDANTVANTVQNLNRGLHVKRIYWDAYPMQVSGTGNSYPVVEALIKQQMQTGALLFDYVGHGRAEMLSHERVLTLNDFKNFNNTNLPLWITVGCDIMPYDGQIENIGEAAVLNEKGGAVATYGTARTVYTNLNKNMNMQFMQALFTPVDGRIVSIGEAQRIAKNKLVSGYSSRDISYNKLAYQLMGDPALVLHIPTEKIVIDSLNGVADLYNTIVTLKAGSIATIAGHVENGGMVLSDYEGTVSLMVRDCEEHIVCRLNNTLEGSTPFSYYDRPNVIFSGSGAVRNGKFSISFTVPLDIRYSNETGMINAFACSDKKLLANGYNSTFLVGGTETVRNDSIGPSIYCYLNTPDFVNGGKVNTTPYFVAQLNDKDGLNTSGAGIGHDLELIIDNDASRTYVLNDNFTFDFGSYVSGSTFYHIPELAEGRHTLKFRAWDAMNNPSTAELQFNVVRGLEPTVSDISVSQNPARTATTFIVNHDRSGSNIDVELEVYDMSGRLLWTHASSGMAATSTYTYDWNLCTNAGAPLQTGVYLYRARVGSDGGSNTSKARRLVVIR